MFITQSHKRVFPTAPIGGSFCAHILAWVFGCKLSSGKIH
jgi:hypothetical protein